MELGPRGKTNSCTHAVDKGLGEPEELGGLFAEEEALSLHWGWEDLSAGRQGREHLGLPVAVLLPQPS